MFCGQQVVLPSSTRLDMPKVLLQDPYYGEDFKLPDQQSLFDAFMAGLSKKSDSDFRRLSQLLATLSDLSLSHTQVEAMSGVCKRAR